MSTLYEYKEKLHGKLYIDEKVIGSCVPFTSERRVFVVTCHHVVFNDESKASEKIDNIILKVNGQSFFSPTVISDANESSQSDVLILEFSKGESQIDFASITLHMGIDIGLLKQYKSEIITSHPNEDSIARVPLCDDLRANGVHYIEGSVAKDAFHHMNKGRGGAQEYSGISGSGIFTLNENGITLVGILGKLPRNSIEQPIVLSRLDSVEQYIPKNIIFQTDEAMPTAELKDVCFVHYTPRSEKYYCTRECDKEFSDNVLGNISIWLHGSSGTGKTALVARNLSSQDVKHIACDLEPITIRSCDDIFQGIVDDITQYVDESSPPAKFDVKSMCQFLIDCNLDDNTVVTIDEMSCSSPEIIEEFCKSIINLVRRYQKQQHTKKIVFVVSSIFHPKKHGCNLGKLMESFDFVCTEEWDSSIERLFDIQNTALGSKICSEGKKVLLDNCDSLPRLLTMLVHKVYRKGEFSIECISDTTARVIREYSEYE